MATGKLDFTERQLLEAFPTNAQIRQPRPIQDEAIIAMANGARILELPTGTGKTALEFMAAKAILDKLDEGETVFWIFPTKALVQQAKDQHPQIKTIFGKNEHPCIWEAEQFDDEPEQPIKRIELPLLYDRKDVAKVSEIPQVLCARCPHFVDQETGQPRKEGSLGCTYFQ